MDASWPAVGSKFRHTIGLWPLYSMTRRLCSNPLPVCDCSLRFAFDRLDLRGVELRLGHVSLTSYGSGVRTSALLTWAKAGITEFARSTKKPTGLVVCSRNVPRSVVVSAPPVRER